MTTAYLNCGLPSSGGVCGGEWFWLVVRWFAPWMPWLIWVRDLMVGDVMVDRSFRVPSHTRIADDRAQARA
ncbi:MAG TPA: hypothetical protein VKG38_08055, partial [Solirubrobacteraceae bacterium]|nr:hypothetical protein [Solirubrobacteraceae bacterium]